MKPAPKNEDAVWPDGNDFLSPSLGRALSIVFFMPCTATVVVTAARQNCLRPSLSLAG
jgi:hypothetical protein